jgi:CRP-like cAMP-binding protein
MAIQEKQYRPGDIVFRQGDAPDGVYIVRSGALEAFHTHGGEELIYALLKPGDMFGEVVVIANEPRMVTVRATDWCVLEFIERTEFLESFGGPKNISLPLLKLLCRRLRDASDMLTGRAPLKRRASPRDSGSKIRIRPGNLMIEKHIGERAIRVARFPFSFGSTAQPATHVEDDGIYFPLGSTEQVTTEHALLELRGGVAYVRHNALISETHVNGERLWAEPGSMEAMLHLGINVVVLGQETSLWRLLIEVKQ